MEEKKALSVVKNIYLIGIGGIGMSGLAMLLKDKGFNVSGSDVKDSDTVRMLVGRGVRVFVGHSRENITPDIDMICCSSAVKEDNPEMMEARRREVTVLKKGELLSLLAWDTQIIAVAGSHGKTTTTSLVGYLLSSLGRVPAVFVGGLPLNYSRTAWWGKDYFVIETDESDGSFLNYNPWFSIITNIDYEHLDYHGSIDNLKASFQRFADQTKGKVVGCGEDPMVKEMVDRAGGWTYGWSKDNKFSAEIDGFDGKYTNFSFYIDGQFISRVKIPLLGKHNVLNTLAVLAFFYHINESLPNVIKLLADFKGVKRRFQIKANIAGVAFVDDYGHHPTEIKAVLDAARYLNFKRVVAIFQPHRYSRAKALAQEFSSCLLCADEVIVTDIYGACEKPIDGINGQYLAGLIREKFASQSSGTGVVHYIPKDRLAAEACQYFKEGDIVIGLGAGDINILMEAIASEFARNRIKT